jgi:hypothetical protein
MKIERSERRMDVMMAGRLAIAGSYPVAEWVAIKNVSVHGARIISGRRWRPNEQVCLGESVGDHYFDAEVVYCERLEGDRYAVGLKFISAADAYESVSAMRSPPPEPVYHARAR